MRDKKLVSIDDLVCHVEIAGRTIPYILRRADVLSGLWTITFDDILIASRVPLSKAHEAITDFEAAVDRRAVDSKNRTKMRSKILSVDQESRRNNMAIKDMTALVESAKSKIENMKRRDVTKARTIINDLENEGIDVDPASDALIAYEEVRDSAQSDYGDRDDHTNAKDDAWDAVAESFDDIDATEVEVPDEDDEHPDDVAADPGPGAAKAKSKGKAKAKVPSEPGEPKEKVAKVKVKVVRGPSEGKTLWQVVLDDGEVKQFSSVDEGAAKYRAYRIAHDQGKKVKEITQVGVPVEAEKIDVA